MRVRSLLISAVRHLLHVVILADSTTAIPVLCGRGAISVDALGIRLMLLRRVLRSRCAIELMLWEAVRLPKTIGIEVESASIRGRMLLRLGVTLLLIHVSLRILRKQLALHVGALL